MTPRPGTDSSPHF